jgi:hypothetical protein
MLAEIPLATAASPQRLLIALAGLDPVDQRTGAAARGTIGLGIRGWLVDEAGLFVLLGLDELHENLDSLERMCGVKTWRL